MHLQLILVGVLLSSCFINSTSSSFVKSIKWRLDNASLPLDRHSKLSAKVLLNVNKFAIGTWYQSKYANQTRNRYLDFKGVGELNIRPPAMEAFALAVSLATRTFDEKAVGKSAVLAKNISVQLIRSLAYRHKVNSKNGWGSAWQSALWTYFAGFGAWLMWDQFDPIDQKYIEQMIIFESNRFMNYTVPYYKDRNGRVITPGDTKAEENAWNSQVLQLSTAMMPTHPNWRRWMRKNVELMVSSFVCENDLKNTTVLNGKSVAEWINGSNVFNNGTLVNHNIIHPDYMANLYSTIAAPMTYSLANVSTPASAFWNAELVYNALVNLEFPSPPFQKPGGSIYVKDQAGRPSAGVYYPQGNDWGYGRRIQFAYIDTLMSLLQPVDQFNASQWSWIHMESVHQMQLRFKDGRTYDPKKPREDVYKAREEWVGSVSACDYLSRWTSYNFELIIDNNDYSK